MSKPVEEFEISALIDGELDPRRATEVQEVLDRDPALRTEFERLSAANTRWATQAETARFQIVLPHWEPATSPIRPPWWLLAALVALLCAGRFVTKLPAIHFNHGLLVHAMLLAVTLMLVCWIARPGIGTQAKIS